MSMELCCIWQTGERGADHIIEVGGPGTLVRSVKSARIGGWIHNIGFLGGFVSASIKQFLHRDKTYTGLIRVTI